MQIERGFIELQSEEPERLASFYERLLGLQREAAGGAITLRCTDLRVVIRKGRRAVQLDEGGTTLFGFTLAAGERLSAVREAAGAAGAVILSETRREDRETLTLVDPDGNEFVITGAAQEASSEIAPVAPQLKPAPVSDLRAPSGRPTRRDWDRLRDEERLASMKETIAGLDVGFSATDPASIMNDMKARLGSLLDGKTLERAEAERRREAEERAARADDLLQRYKQELAGAPAPPSTPEAATQMPDETSELKPPKRTLGPSAGGDERAEG
jgi:hypothetical protein